MIGVHHSPTTTAWDRLNEGQALEVFGIFASAPTTPAAPWSSRIDGIEIDPVIADMMMNGGVK
ncbi:hypothetical protein PE067_09205 [Paracoccus sp. DMF-8]|uniref:hypothetical protein n=1 Tax=Paracoccus sp. DMF-8 TaxID=3019445 RepID=UPI0023E7C47D|nr:hypothetical protein [Paracoccus sp. DMF-8]MDF3606295.1 hypothetical protein [Paracoccus sp. DMF-8]